MKAPYIHPRRLKDFAFLALLCLGAAAGILLASEYGNTPSYECADCNILLISVDSLRADRVGLLGGNRTPHIDTYFADGLIFENYITASYLTPITEMAAHTGLHPLSSGVTGFGSLLPASTKMLAERLRDAGYATAAFGTSPEFFYFLPAMQENFSRGFDSYFEASRLATTSAEAYELRFEAPADAAAWLSGRREEDGKFFLWLALGTAHFPYGRWCDDNGTYDGFLEDKLLHWNNDTLRRIYDGTVWSLEQGGSPVTALSAEDAEHIRSCYDGSVSQADAYVGMVLDALKRSGLDDKTLVILHSEHGEDMGEHGTFLHYDIYDANIRTPLLLKYPGNPSRRIASPVGSADILPTLLQLTGLPGDPSLEGASLLPLIADADAEERYAFSVRTPLWEAGIGDVPTLREMRADAEDDVVFGAFLDTLARMQDEDVLPDVAIRTKEWKLIWRRGREIEKEFGWWSALTGKEILREEYELYEVSSDPDEQENVHDAYPAVAATLREALEGWVAIQESGSQLPRQTLPIQPYF